MEGIDRAKVRLALRRTDDETLFFLLDAALDVLPDAQLDKLLARHFDLKRLSPGAEVKSVGLLVQVEAFDKASRRGEYYERFSVNSKNCTQKSKGTLGWIAECQRLLRLCSLGQHKAVELRDAIDIIFRLLSDIEDEPDDIIFFADEGGSWQVGVDWAKIFPVWFASLSATVDSDSYAARVIATIDKFDEQDRDKHLAEAKRLATPEQQRALDRTR